MAPWETCDENDLEGGHGDPGGVWERNHRTPVVGVSLGDRLLVSGPRMACVSSSPLLGVGMPSYSPSACSGL